MPILRCSVSECYHNKSEECTLEKIHVGGRDAVTSTSTECEDFQPKTDSFKSSMDDANKVCQPVVNIACEAHNCKYNDNLQCAADHIAVKNPGCNCG